MVFSFGKAGKLLGKYKETHFHLPSEVLFYAKSQKMQTNSTEKNIF